MKPPLLNKHHVMVIMRCSPYCKVGSNIPNICHPDNFFNETKSQLHFLSFNFAKWLVLIVTKWLVLIVTKWFVLIVTKWLVLIVTKRLIKCVNFGRFINFMFAYKTQVIRKPSIPFKDIITLTQFSSKFLILFKNVKFSFQQKF